MDDLTLAIQIQEVKSCSIAVMERIFAFHQDLVVGRELPLHIIRSSGCCSVTRCNLVALREGTYLWLPKQSQIEVSIFTLLVSKNTKVVDIHFLLVF